MALMFRQKKILREITRWLALNDLVLPTVDEYAKIKIQPVIGSSIKKAFGNWAKFEKAIYGEGGYRDNFTERAKAIKAAQEAKAKAKPAPAGKKGK